MKRAIVITLLAVSPPILHAGVIRWERKPLSVSISTERLTRIEFPESRALASEIEDTLFVVGESGTAFEVIPIWSRVDALIAATNVSEVDRQVDHPLPVGGIA